MVLPSPVQLQADLQLWYPEQQGHPLHPNNQWVTAYVVQCVVWSLWVLHAGALPQSSVIRYALVLTQLFQKYPHLSPGGLRTW